MRNEDKWHPEEDDDASDRLMGYGIVGAFTGLLILCAIASMAFTQFLRH
ncbi:hypothetical protein AADG64_22460 [Achromobacter xylosoxidans]